MSPKRLTILATVFILVSIGSGYGSAAGLSSQALSQIKDFIQFYKDDPKVLSSYRIMEGLCREEDGQANAIIDLLQATRTENPNGTLPIDAIQENFLKLTANDLDYVQDIFLYQIKTGKRFDLNFFHNLSVRSALNAIRLHYRDADSMPESIRMLKNNIEQLRRDIISSDQQLVSAAKLEANKRNYIPWISKVNHDNQSKRISLDDPGFFSSFYEVVLTFYSMEFIKGFNFFDHYEFMQYLLLGLD